jgi:hypothetical protein
VEVEKQIIYVQLGCEDGTSQSIAVNIYTDNTCETRDVTDGYDDSNIDVSDIQVRPLVVSCCFSTSFFALQKYIY